MDKFLVVCRIILDEFSACVMYYPNSLTFDGVFEFYKREINWQKIRNRFTKFYSDCSYYYSGAYHPASKMPVNIAKIITELQILFRVKLNSCLLNWYPDGNSCIPWHSDNESALGQQPFIVTVSLGAVRMFQLKHNYSEMVAEVNLENNSILVMFGNTQTFWKHAILPIKNAPARLSLTFRNIEKA